VWPEPDAREPWFLCEAHSDSVIDETLNRFEDAVQDVKQGKLKPKSEFKDD
jgi:hypothetical protein